MAGVVRLNFGTIDHAEFGRICENLSSDIKLLRFKSTPPGTVAAGGNSVAAGREELNAEFLADIHTRLLVKFHGCWPNDLDEEVSVKVRDCVEEAVSSYCPGLDASNIIELHAVRCITESASRDNGSGFINPTAGDESDDDEEEEEDGAEVYMVEYAFGGKFLYMLREALGGNGDLVELVDSIPNIHSADISMDTLATAMLREMVVRPEWTDKTPAQREPVIAEFIANTQATILTHYDYMTYNRFTVDTYNALFETDNCGALFLLELHALFAGVELSAHVRQDILFQRTRTLFAMCSLQLHALVNMEYDFKHDLVIGNVLLIRLYHVTKGDSDDPKATRSQLAAIINSWLGKLHSALIDLQLLLDVLPTLFPPDDELRKYLQLLVTGWNGRLQFYAKQQQKRLLNV